MSVSAIARRSNRFFTTRNSPSTFFTSRRRLVIACTFRPVKSVRKIASVLLSRSRISATNACFSSLVMTQALRVKLLGSTGTPGPIVLATVTLLT